MRDGAVTLHGPVHDTSLIPVAERLVHGTEGVVDVEPHLSGADSNPAGTCPTGWPPWARVALRFTSRGG
ncbi:BON domain-containing protein [Streptomyces sp. AF1A]|uniref:BON domain-containing protein n=1 Tax=Streptomyces sp. AF1A TaxID=3394350 RepID=UPI0039BD21EC